MGTVNAKENTSKRKTLYFDDKTARMLAERAKEEHRSESNYLQFLIIQDNRAKQAAVLFLAKFIISENSKAFSGSTLIRGEE